MAMASPRISASPQGLASPAAYTKAICIKDHEALDEFQLTLKVGDLVFVLEQDPTGWWGGYLEGQEATAWFPGGCVEIVPPAEDSFEQGSGIMRGQKEFGNVNTTGPETDSPSPIRKTTAVASPQRRGSLRFSPSALEFQPRFTPQGASESQPTQLVQVMPERLNMEAAQYSPADELLLQEQRKRADAEKQLQQMRQELEKERKELEKERQERRRSQGVVDQLEFNLSREQEATKKIADEKKRIEYENQRIHSEIAREKKENDQKTLIIHEKDVEIKQLHEHIRRFSVDSVRPYASPCSSPAHHSLNMSLELPWASPSPSPHEKARATSAKNIRSLSPASFAPIAATRTDPALRVQDETPPPGCVAERVRSLEQNRQRSNVPLREGLPLHERPSTRELRPPKGLATSASGSSFTGPVIPQLPLGRMLAFGGGSSTTAMYDYNMERIPRPMPCAQRN